MLACRTDAAQVAADTDGIRLGSGQAARHRMKGQLQKKNNSSINSTFHSSLSDLDAGKGQESLEVLHSKVRYSDGRGQTRVDQAL